MSSEITQPQYRANGPQRHSRNGQGTPVGLTPEDFEIERTEMTTRVNGVDVGSLAVDADAGQLSSGKESDHGVAFAHQFSVPRLLGACGVR